MGLPHLRAVGTCEVSGRRDLQVILTSQVVRKGYVHCKAPPKSKGYCDSDVIRFAHWPLKKAEVIPIADRQKLRSSPAEGPYSFGV